MINVTKAETNNDPNHGEFEARKGWEQSQRPKKARKKRESQNFSRGTSRLMMTLGLALPGIQRTHSPQLILMESTMEIILNAILFIFFLCGKIFLCKRICEEYADKICHS